MSELVHNACVQLEENLKREGILVERIWEMKDIEVSETLWLTDSESAARRIAGHRQPVLAWLHEENAGAGFANIRYVVEQPQELGSEFFEAIYRRYLGIPWDILQTDRCLVRETSPEDAGDFARIYGDPEVTRYTEPFCREPEAEKDYIKEYVEKVYDFYGYGVWTILWKETGEVIGRAGFEQSDPPGLGYMVAPAWQRRGIGYEVCRALLSLAEQELGFERVQVKIHKENQASVALAEKLGFYPMPEEKEKTTVCMEWKASSKCHICQ